MTAAQIDRAFTAAEAAFDAYRSLPAADRAAFLERIGVEIEALGDELLAAAMSYQPDPFPVDLGCPVCIAWPTEDRMTPERPCAARFAAALPSARGARLAGAGHIPMVDVPDQVAAVILAGAGGVDGAVRAVRAAGPAGTSPGQA